MRWATQCARGCHRSVLVAVRGGGEGEEGGTCGGAGLGGGRMTSLITQLVRSKDRVQVGSNSYNSARLSEICGPRTRSPNPTTALPRSFSTYDGASPTSYTLCISTPECLNSIICGDRGQTLTSLYLENDFYRWSSLRDGPGRGRLSLKQVNTCASKHEGLVRRCRQSHTKSRLRSCKRMESATGKRAIRCCRVKSRLYVRLIAVFSA